MEEAEREKEEMPLEGKVGRRVGKKVRYWMNLAAMVLMLGAACTPGTIYKFFWEMPV